ncbi:DHA2 family efflux MFS transporter permease subunit [Rhodovastum atsumiense]|uniref:DHA2 family efflux MFS transporter permease subunit n=1 Tax=Rhodovastum atsumiense TaxID=504468 RepID=A0A5M6IN94_9PROT|nr:DHA2 family efflux MFS transporter permease subunit [Rhodovastum atsumiense]KAA5609740.1 DHA2 family efflux MFS transporter permease subunit [Rhodovastum atsumiense]CAH2604512.1 DHA2 family efflux MFS transporter permease subunit [Rhodovastum atsumiense]
MTPPAPPMSERAKFVGFLIMALGMFMALLDVQIVASSLGEIQAGLAASPDEISWIQTAYLIAEVVMIPLSGWLARVFSTRWVFTASAIGFTLTSIGCGFAWSIGSMVAFRAVQGFVGGAMIPLAFATGYTLFTGPKAVLIPAILGGCANLAPTLGPSIGGWITQAWSWHWLFFLNVLPGLVIAIGVPLLIRFDRPDFGLLKGFDALSIPFVAAALGGLEYVLEEGVRDDWFDDDLICLFAIVSALSFVVVIWRSLTHRNPVLDLRALRNRNFALGCVLSFILGFGIFGSVYLLPLFLARVRGYDSLQIGQAVFVTGIFQLLSTAIVAPLSRRVDPRRLLVVGFALFGIGLWMTGQMTSQWSGAELLWPQAVRGFASMFVIVPITVLALGNLPPARLKMASGLYNLMRNLGGAVGIAVIGILLQNRERLHAARLADHAIAANAAMGGVLDRLASRFDAVMGDADRAQLAALGMLQRLARREALTLTFNDILLVMAALFFLALLLIPLLRRPGAAAPVSDH